ncbi:MAG: O-antigen ligase family protein [Phycisphaerae bacterium]|nr:O-antigen ligase family protein [Phycisphaerae bacterium]
MTGSKRKKRRKNVPTTEEFSSSSAAEDVSGRLAERLRGAAVVLTLACVAGRAFIAEMPFRQSPIQISEILAAADRPGQPSVGLVQWTELARALLAVLLLTAGVVWLAAGAIEGKLIVRHGRLAVLIGAFAVWSFISAWRAVDARSAWIAWLEQVSFLSAGFVTLQLCTTRRRLVLIASVLAAVGLALAVKGLMQVGWERDEAARMFELYGPQRLADMGLQPGDPKALAYEHRILSTTPTAYFGLANVLAGGLALMLAAGVGLAVAKALHARHCRRRDGPMPSGHIRPAFMAAGLTVAAVIPTAIVLALTRSRGGIIATACVLLAATAGLRFRAVLARRWKWSAAVVGLLIALGMAGVVAYGLAKDRLPSKTMSVRWFYWTGSAQIVREHPVWGVGPGNFPRAYLRVRRPEAEEAVKTPHNVIAHAMTQYGLPGGALYLLVLGGVLVLAWKPAAGRNDALGTDESPSRNSRSLLIAGGCITAAVLFCRAFFGEADFDPALFLLEGVAPAVVFGAALALERWFGGAVEDLPDASIRAIRIALAAGCAAMALHNLVSFSLWMAGTAGMFWVAGGAAAAMGDARPTVFRKIAFPAALLGCVGLSTAVVFGVVPVAERLAATRDAAEALLQHQPSRAVVHAERAADGDPLDAYAAMNAARFCLASPTDRFRRDATGEPAAMVWAREAIRRDDSTGAYRLAIQVARELNLPGAGAFWREAIPRDPVDARQRLDYAAWLLDHHQADAAAEQLAEAERIDEKLRAFDPESGYRFGEREMRQMRSLRRRVKASK